MINTLEYSQNQNQNGLVDLFNTTGSSCSHKNLFYHQEQQTAQVHQHHHHLDQHTQQQHHNIIYQNQQHLIDYNASQNCSNQYSNFSYGNNTVNQLPIHQNNTSMDQNNYLTSLSTPNMTVQNKGSVQSVHGINVSGFDQFCQKLDAQKEEDEDLEDEEDSDDEFDEEDDDYEDDENEEASFSNKKNYNKRVKKAEVDHENDYEIKHNCLAEDGGYMSTLFNSPSSLSSSSGGNIDLRTKQSNSGNSYQYANVASCNILGNNISLMNESLSLKNDLKTEVGEDHDNTTNNNSNSANTTQFNSQGSFSSSSSISNFNEPHKMNNQHMTNMINSYSKCGIMNDYDLVNLPLRELNKRLRALPKQMAYNMKKRRRTLKNRKYAQNCRSKRLEQKSEMEIQNHHLKSEISRLSRVIEKYKNEVATLRVAIGNKNNSIHQVNLENQNVKSEHISFSNNTTGNTTINMEELNKSNMISNSNPNSDSRDDIYHIDKRNCSQLTHLLSLPNQHHHYNHNQQHLSQIQQF